MITYCKQIIRKKKKYSSLYLISSACKNLNFFVGFSLPLPTALPVGNSFLWCPRRAPSRDSCPLVWQTRLCLPMHWNQVLLLLPKAPSWCALQAWPRWVSTGSQSHFGWKKPLGSWSPTINLVLPDMWTRLRMISGALVGKCVAWALGRTPCCLHCLLVRRQLWGRWRQGFLSLVLFYRSSLGNVFSANAVRT